MSQAKVDQYKKEKANRRETVAKERRNKKITKFVVSLCGVLIAGWIGVSVFEVIKENRPVETIYCDIDAIDGYLNGLMETK